MSAWSGLLKKEFRLGLTGFFLAFALLLLCLGLGVFLLWKFADPSLLFGVAVGVMGGHVFYLPGYLAVSLYGEKGKMHLWLHNAHSGWTLFMAKFLNGLLAMAVSLLIASAIALYVGGVVLDIFSWSNVLMIGLFLILHIMGVSLYLTVWGVFLWTINHLLGQMIGKFRWVVMVALVIFGLYLLSNWETSSLFMTLTQWGALPLDSFSSLASFNFTVQEGRMNAEVETNNLPVVYIGTYVYYALVAFVVFLASSWLLDKKVEV